MPARKLIGITATLLALATVPSTADAVTLMINGDTPSIRIQREANKAYVPLPENLTLALYLRRPPEQPEHGPGAPTCGTATWDGTRIWVWCSDDLASTVLHESFHALDIQRGGARGAIGNDPRWIGMRNQFKQRFGYHADADWWTDQPKRISPGEWAAYTYTSCANTLPAIAALEYGPRFIRDCRFFARWLGTKFRS